VASRAPWRLTCSSGQVAGSHLPLPRRPAGGGGDAPDLPPVVPGHREEDRELQVDVSAGIASGSLASMDAPGRSSMQDERPVARPGLRMWYDRAWRSCPLLRGPDAGTTAAHTVQVLLCSMPCLHVASV
jgi:hypothetical protein